MNKLFYGDNLDILRKFIRDETVDLCYIDPPFNSKRNYNQIYNNIGQEDRAQAQAFVDTWTWDDHANECLDEILANKNGVQTKNSIGLRLPALLFIVFIFIFGSTISGQDARLIAKNTFPSVVMLEMRDDKNRPISLGSGFFVRPDIVATNFHVIEGASAGHAKIVGQQPIYQIEGVVGIDKLKDLALLKLIGAKGKPLVLADISKIEVGEEIFALGNPKGLEGTISTGIISSSLRNIGNENLIQITAPISPGSSGGPVINKKGEVIGVAVASLKDGQNLNFATPSSFLIELLAKASSNVVILSNATQETKASSISSIAETSAWISEKLTAKGGLTQLNIMERNEQFIFDNCNMNFIFTMKNKYFQTNYSYIAPLNTLKNTSLSDDYKTVMLIFSEDALQVKQDDYEEGNLVKSNRYRWFGFHIWVGDKELGLRVINAFNHLGKLCKEQTKKEPF